MSEARLADALVRLENHKNLHLPLRSRDLLGRLALRFLWKRQVKWQVEANLAARDAIDSLRDICRAQQSALDELTRHGPSSMVTQEQLGTELDHLRRSDQNMMAGLNQRLYAAIGSMRTDLGDLRLQLLDKAGDAGAVEERLAALDEKIAELTTAARDVRIRHAQLDLFLDQARAARAGAGTDTEAVHAGVPERASFLELAVAELLDGPAEQTRNARQAYMPIVEAARAAGATGSVFDVAPARAEWLELLRAAEIPAAAASTNPFVVKNSAALGFSLDEADPLDVLARTSGRSLGAITAFRYVERLDPSTLARFVDLASQALQPGGVLIVESPNSDGVATGDFHLDPFAQRPVHPTFLRFLAEASGFSTVEVRYSEGGPLSRWSADMSASEARRSDRYCLLAWM